MNKNKFTFFNLIRVYILGFVMNRKSSTSKVVMPKRIGSYGYVSALGEKSGKTAVGIYKDKRGRKVVAKIWSNKFKDYSYYSLKNEIEVYKAIGEVTRRLKNKMPISIKNVRIPQFISSYENDNSLVLVIEWVKGENSENLPIEKKLDAYFKIIKYLDYIGDHMNRNEKNRITVRKGSYYLLLFPIILIFSLMMNIDDSLAILFGGVVFAQYAHRLFPKRKLSLVHRDLHFGNILISNENISLIDLQFCVFTYRVYDFASTIRNIWANKRDVKLFLERVYTTYGNNSDISELIKPILILFTIQGLTAQDFSRKIIVGFRELLIFGTHINQKNYAKYL